MYIYMCVYRVNPPTPYAQCIAILFVLIHSGLIHTPHSTRTSCELLSFEWSHVVSRSMDLILF